MERLLEVYKWVVRYYEVNQAPPTIDEINEGLQLHSKSAVSYCLDHLVGLGVLEYAGEHGSARRVRVTGGKWSISPARVVASWRIITE